MMPYHALNEKTLVAYLLGRPAVAARFDRGADLTVKEVGDGNLNLVFIVANRDEPAQDVIAKQALNYLRVAGESWPLTRERMRSESQAMQTYARIAVSAVIPRFWWSISLTRVAGMCVSFARRYPVTDSGFRNSSSRISPG